jgi:hypothetical protein
MSDGPRLTTFRGVSNDLESKPPRDGGNSGAYPPCRLYSSGPRLLRHGWKQQEGVPCGRDKHAQPRQFQQSGQLATAASGRGPREPASGMIRQGRCSQLNVRAAVRMNLPATHMISMAGMMESASSQERTLPSRRQYRILCPHHGKSFMGWEACGRA